MAQAIWAARSVNFRRTSSPAASQELLTLSKTATGFLVSLLLADLLRLREEANPHCLSVSGYTGSGGPRTTFSDIPSVREFSTRFPHRSARLATHALSHRRASLISWFRLVLVLCAGASCRGSACRETSCNETGTRAKSCPVKQSRRSDRRSSCW